VSVRGAAGDGGQRAGAVGQYRQQQRAASALSWCSAYRAGLVSIPYQFNQPVGTCPILPWATDRRRSALVTPRGARHPALSVNPASRPWPARSSALSSS
jgi:hypothetical protein